MTQCKRCGMDLRAWERQCGRCGRIGAEDEAPAKRKGRRPSRYSSIPIDFREAAPVIEEDVRTRRSRQRMDRSRIAIGSVAMACGIMTALFFSGAIQTPGAARAEQCSGAECAGEIEPAKPARVPAAAAMLEANAMVGISAPEPVFLRRGAMAEARYDRRLPEVMAAVAIPKVKKKSKRSRRWKRKKRGKSAWKKSKPRKKRRRK